MDEQTPLLFFLAAVIALLIVTLVVHPHAPAADSITTASNTSAPPANVTPTPAPARDPGARRDHAHRRDAEGSNARVAHAPGQQRSFLERIFEHATRDRVDGERDAAASHEHERLVERDAW